MSGYSEPIGTQLSKDFCNVRGLRRLCSPPVAYLKVQTAMNAPNLSRRMRYGQLVTSVNGERRRTTVIGVDRLPANMRPSPSVVVPLTNF